MKRPRPHALVALVALAALLLTAPGCLATKPITGTAKMAVKGTVKATGAVVRKAADLAIPDKEEPKPAEPSATAPKRKK